MTVLVVITILGCRTTPYAQHSRLPQGQCREPRPDVHTRLCFEADVCVLLGFVSLLARVNNFEYLRGPCCNDVGTWSELICHILSDLDVKLSKNMFCMLLPRVMRSGNLVKNGKKKTQFLVKNGIKSEYFLMRIFWIGRDLPLLTESKKKQFFLMPPRIIPIGTQMYFPNWISKLLCQRSLFTFSAASQ